LCLSVLWTKTTEKYISDESIGKVRNMETKMELKEAEAWLVRAEETLYDADMEFNNATKSTKKELKEVLVWAQQQLEDAASAVLTARHDLGESSEKEETADEKETSKEE